MLLTITHHLLSTVTSSGSNSVVKIALNCAVVLEISNITPSDVSINHPWTTGMWMFFNTLSAWGNLSGNQDCATLNYCIGSWKYCIDSSIFCRKKPPVVSTLTCKAAYQKIPITSSYLLASYLSAVAHHTLGVPPPQANLWWGGHTHNHHLFHTFHLYQQCDTQPKLRIFSWLISPPFTEQSPMQPLINIVLGTQRWHCKHNSMPCQGTAAEINWDSARMSHLW